jgi:hypothetical protein
MKIFLGMIFILFITYAAIFQLLFNVLDNYEKTLIEYSKIYK